MNVRDREICCKIVYYGPSMGGKTTNITVVHERAPDESRSRLKSIDTTGDRTLFFDFFSLNLGDIGGMRTSFQIYGVPGQPRYRETRRMVLSGADGIVFVADSSRARLGDNLESLEDMRQLTAEHGMDLARTPLVFQWNKRDLDDISDVGDLRLMLNQDGRPSYEAVATEGQGVLETFKAVCAEVVVKLNEDLSADQGLTAGGKGKGGR